MLEGKLFFSLRNINKLQEITTFVHKCCRFLEHFKQCGVLQLAHLQRVFLFWYEYYLGRAFISAVCHFLVRNFSLSCILAADVMVHLLFAVCD